MPTGIPPVARSIPYREGYVEVKGFSGYEHGRNDGAVLSAISRQGSTIHLTAKQPVQRN